MGNQIGRPRGQLETVDSLPYIQCKVNKHNVKALIDTGGFTSIMSEKCAEQCGILHLADADSALEVSGAGNNKQGCYVHLCCFKVGNLRLHSKFLILKDFKVDMLLGIDTLRRYQCCINLTDDSILFQSSSPKTEKACSSDFKPLAALAKMKDSDETVPSDAERKKAIEANKRAASACDPKYLRKPKELEIEYYINDRLGWAVVDSGAECCVMTAWTARQHVIWEDIDQSCKTTLSGLGKQTTIGIIHDCPIKIGKEEFRVSVKVLQSLVHNMVIGSNLLRKLQCTIDLKSNRLLIGSTGESIGFEP